MDHSNFDVAAYNSDFFQVLEEESRQAAAVVVPLLLDLFPIRSVLDVGCGVGAWIEAFRANAVLDAIGVDGDYVDRSRLLIPLDTFYAHDLLLPMRLGRAFDLVVCLEVAEHLPSSAAACLVETLTRHGELIVFSAAIPGQGGTNHLNEQWPTYWAGHFAAAGYEAYDVLRPRLWRDERVGFWFRQNLLVFASGTGAKTTRAVPPMTPPIDLVHPRQFSHRNEELGRIPSIRVSFRHLMSAIHRRLMRWVLPTK